MVGTPVNEPSADELLAAVNIAVLPQDLEAALAAADDIQVVLVVGDDFSNALLGDWSGGVGFKVRLHVPHVRSEENEVGLSELQDILL